MGSVGAIAIAPGGLNGLKFDLLTSAE
ncbi:MAG: hypothetical protein RIR89_1125, partial [Actinomycetota bacterium]